MPEGEAPTAVHGECLLLKRESSTQRRGDAENYDQYVRYRAARCLSVFAVKR